MLLVIIFFIFYLFAAYFEIKGGKGRDVLIVATCIALVCMAGFRDVDKWADTGVYVLSFKLGTPSLENFSFDSKPFGYVERGFFYLQVIVKAIYNDYVVFFLVVAALSIYFLYRNIMQYSIFPLVGLLTYISRFYMGRNLIQIRAGLSYAIVLLGIRYIYEKDWKRYFLIVFIAWLFHRSAIVGVPLYFICNWVNVKKKYVVIALMAAFVVGFWGQEYVHMVVEDNASDLDVSVRYTDAGGEKHQLEGLGMRNPIIYFQCFVLLVYTFLEKKLQPLNKYYYVIRCAYLYSAAILICFNSYKVLSGRTSSIYATLEFAIIPSLIFLFNKKRRILAIFLTGVVLSAIFYLYLTK